MRLGQLARVVELKPKELISFLEEKGISSYSHANSKVSDEDESLVLHHFGKIQETTAESESDEYAEETKPEANEETEIASVDSPEEAAPIVAIEVNEVPAATEDQEKIEGEEEPEEIELIKAPKIELPGLKVIGKIDLPEPPKKEEKSEEDQESDTTAASETRSKRKYDDRKRRKDRRKNTDPDFNPVKAKREREKRQTEKKRATQKKKEKQRKAEHYFEKVAPSQAKANKKQKTVKPASYSQVVMEKEAAEKRNGKKGNVLVRLWRWLNTY